MKKIFVGVVILIIALLSSCEMRCNHMFCYPEWVWSE